MKRTILALLMVFSLLPACFFASGEGEQPDGAENGAPVTYSLADYLHRYPDSVKKNEDGSVTEIFTDISQDTFNAFIAFIGDKSRPKEVRAKEIKYENGNLREGENRSIVGEIDFMSYGKYNGRNVRPILTFCYYTETREMHLTYPAGIYDERTRTANEQYTVMVSEAEAGRISEAVQAYRKIPEAWTYQPAITYIASHSDLATAISQNRFQIRGEYVSFGRYEQDNNIENGPEAIEWLVLDVQDGKSLLVSRYALDTVPYNTSYEPVTWETSSIRTWLNNDFSAAAFSSAEKDAILESEVDNSMAQGNSEYTAPGGSNTQDRVFLLSCGEVFRYFGADEVRKCSPTAYAISRGAWTSPDEAKTSGWWLRSPGSLPSCAMRISSNGSGLSAFVDYDETAVRPAIWINLDSDYFRTN